MAVIRYGKRALEPGGLSADELFEQLAEFFLHSGFFDRWQGSDYTLEDLRRAVLSALAEQSVIPLEELERMLDLEDELSDSPYGELVDQMIDQLVEQGYVSFPGHGGHVSDSAPGQARFELTGKGLDFLGYKTLQETLSKAGRDSFGRHDTNLLATGVGAAEAPKPYEFGDTMNLDATATVLEAVKRGGCGFPLTIEPADLRVRQGELEVSSATVVMLDCSHSMILYGEDRFTPAKRVALALSHLIRTRYPGDELSLVLFHDSAEEVPIVHLPRVQIGPFHTNTAAGLQLARRILARTRREMRQIVMITDGKPSALTLPDGRIYKNSFGLDPFITEATFAEVVKCRRAGILINTFMLARDRALIAFVKRVSEIARGKAYFTSPMTLGKYVTMDFMNNKVDLLN